jgi:hypothetical protein
MRWRNAGELGVGDRDRDRDRRYRHTGYEIVAKPGKVIAAKGRKAGDKLVHMNR